MISILYQMGEKYAVIKNVFLFYDDQDTASSSYSSYRPVSVSWWYAHSRAVVFHTLYRGQRDTRLCPYLVSTATLYYLPLYQPKSLTIFPCHFYIPSPSASAVVGFVYLDFFSSSPACSHHRIPTPDPDVLSVLSNRYIIHRVAMNCATTLCLLRI